MEKFSKNYSTSVIIYLALSFTILVLIGVCELLTALGVKPLAHGLSGQTGVLRYAFYILGISMVFSIRFVKAVILGRSFVSEEAAVNALTVSEIVTGTLNESSALTGFILFMLSGNRLDFYVLISVSLASAVINFPKKEKWEETLRTVRENVTRNPGSGENH